MKNDLNAVRNLLFQTLEELVNPDEKTKMDVDKAKAVVSVSSVLVDTAKVELEFLKLTQGQKSEFFQGKHNLIEPPK